MSSRLRLFTFAAAAVVLLFLPIFAYVGTFGAQWSRSQEAWGQFGDFFGGFLNPLFALLAFSAVLFNLHMQAQQLDATREEFRNAAEVGQKQIDALREQANRDELVSILLSLTEALDRCLDEKVSPLEPAIVLRLRHVLHEGLRLRHQPFREGPYQTYVLHARTGGSVIEELHARVRGTADDLAHFVPLYAAQVGENSPVLRYYSRRYLGLGMLLADVGGASGSTIDFFRVAENEAAE